MQRSRRAAAAASRPLAPALRRSARAAGSASAAAGRAVGSAARTAAPAVTAVRRVVGPVLAVVTTAGWVVLATAAVLLVLSIALAWQETLFLALVLLAALVLAALFLVGRASYRVEIELEPRRVVVGERARGRMVVTNTGARSSSPVRMELPVGRGLAEFSLPSMAAGAAHEELFAVPTNRRAVIVAGPAESVRGDQLGLLRRAVRWADPVDLFVHPITTRLSPSAAGLVRDLEGQVSRKITNSDIAFHALRPYVPGDDRRYVHWRTSARIGQLMVRQFEETRRSQLTIVHSAADALYAGEDEYELAVSVTASIAAQVIRDGTQMNVVSEQGVWRTPTVSSMLDHSCRVDPVTRRYGSLREFARDRTRRLPAPSVVMIVAGSLVETAELRGVEALFGQDTSVLAFRVVAGAAPAVSRVGSLSLATVGALSDLDTIVRSIT